MVQGEFPVWSRDGVAMQIQPSILVLKSFLYKTKRFVVHGRTSTVLLPHEPSSLSFSWAPRMLLVLLMLVLSLLRHVTADGIRKLVNCGVGAMLGDQGMQVTGVAWWAPLWESQLLNHHVSFCFPPRDCSTGGICYVQGKEQANHCTALCIAG